MVPAIATRPIYNFLASLPLPSPPSSLIKWAPGVSPLSTHTEVFSALLVYLVVIFGGQWLMADRKAFRESVVAGAGSWEEARAARGC